MHATFLLILRDRMEGKLKDQSFHFTLVDIKPAVIARDIVIFLLLDDLSKVIRTSGPKRSLLLACLYYTYLSSIMPGRLATLLQARIQLAIDILEDKKPPPAYLDIPHIHRPEVLRVLKQWQHDASARLFVAKMRREIGSQRFRDKFRSGLHMGPMPDMPPAWRMEELFYEQTGVLTVPKPFDAVCGDDIRAAFEASSMQKIERKDAVAEKVTADWASNVTMIDLDWVEAPRGIDGTDVDVAHNPWQFGAALRGLVPMKPGARLFDMVSMWFTIVADCFSDLKGDLVLLDAASDHTLMLDPTKPREKTQRSAKARSIHESTTGSISRTSLTT